VKLIAGLGNPGRKYEGTRHNIGWQVLAELARRHGTSKPRAKFQGELVEANIAGERAILLSPLTYMNRSGDCVQPARDFYKLDNTDVLIICDDFNLPAARIRVRARGSAGGQKGLQDVIRRLGTDEVSRLRIGIGAAPDGWDVSSFVTSKFQEEEIQPMREAVARATDAAEVWCREGVQVCMNRFNADPSSKRPGKPENSDENSDENS